MGDLPRPTSDGLFSIMLRPCTAEILRHLLDPKVPFAWVVGHYPNRYLEWWKCRLPLSRSSEAVPLEVRGLRFDLLMPTSELLERLTDFDGVVLHQMRRNVPNTLPHAMECAAFTTVERSAMAKALASETV